MAETVIRRLEQTRRPDGAYPTLTSLQDETTALRRELDRVIVELDRRQRDAWTATPRTEGPAPRVPAATAGGGGALDADRLRRPAAVIRARNREHQREETSIVINQYDEYPVHQAPYPFSYIPSTDYAWNEGYYFGLYNADEGRVPLRRHAGQPEHRHDRRLRRRERPRPADHGPLQPPVAGPRRHEHRAVLDPLRRTAPADPDEPWRRTTHRSRSTSTGSASANIIEEPHHLAESRGRRTSDLTRYYQSGTADGWIQVGDKRFTFEPGQWWGSRDHSWGLYLQRAPLLPDPKWLPPSRAARRAPRPALGVVVGVSPENSGFFSVHESEEGEQVHMSDVFGTPLEGGIDLRRTARDTLKLVEAQPRAGVPPRHPGAVPGRLAPHRCGRRRSGPRST